MCVSNNHKYKTVGMMLFDEQRQFYSHLYTRNQSLIWENSCGSGTASMGF